MNMIGMRRLVCWIFHRRHWHRSEYYGRKWYVCWRCLTDWGYR